MRLSCRSPWIAVAALLASAPAFATSYVMMDDAALADQAAAVVDARVVSVEPAPASGLPATDYTIEVERLLAGSAPGTTLIVRVPGGVRPDGVGLEIYGAPAFRVGERAILFLGPRDDGAFGITQLMLGAFHRIEVAGAPSLAVRFLSDAAEVTPPGRASDARLHGPRDFDAFASWLSDRSQGLTRAQDYFVPAAEGELRHLGSKFTLLGAGGFNLRWFEFDTGGEVDWQANSAGEPGAPGGGFSQFRQGLQVWNDEPRTPIRLVYRGTTGARGGFSNFDGRNVLLQNDPNKDIQGSFSCNGGGVLAIGGPWFDTATRRSFGGREYIVIQGADIVTNDGISCFLTGSSCPGGRIALVYGHELGHTLGLGHSCGDDSSPACNTNPAFDDALMRASIHPDCRPLALKSDDVEGIRRLYSAGNGGGGPRGPAAPTGLTGELRGATVRLTWEDESQDETGFRIYRSTNGSAFAQLAEVDPDVTAFIDDDIAPATVYDYRLVSFNAKGESARSQPVEVTVPPVTPVSAGISRASMDAIHVGEPVAFLAHFSGPGEEAVWSFGDDAVGYNDTPCAAGTFCRSQIFTSPGPHAVQVRVIGDFGQVAQDTIDVDVLEAPFETVSQQSFVQSVIFGPRGTGGTFESNVWLYNAGAMPALVRLTYLPRGAEAPPAPRVLTISPAESIFLPNILQKVFDVAAGQGSVAIELSQAETGEGAMPQVFAIARSFVDQDNPAQGSFGQLVSEQPEGTWTANDKLVTGILEGDGFVSTLLGANVDDHSGRVDVDLFDAAGDPVGTTASFSLGPKSVRFRPIPDLFPEAGSRQGPFTARFSSNGIRFVASSTLLETGSEDQIFVPAKEPVEADELILPRVVRSQGQFEVFLTTRVSILNNATVPTSLTLQLLARGQNNSAPLEVHQTVPAGGLLSLPDVISDAFGLETGTGALRVLWSNSQGIAPRVLAMTLSENPHGDRFGMLIDSRTPDEAVTGRGVDFGAEQSDLFHAQFGAVNLRDGATRLHLTLRDANGDALADTTLSLKPRQHFELNLLTVFGPAAASGRNWSVTVDVDQGGPVMTYLANINASGDIFLVPDHAVRSDLAPAN